MRLLVRFALPLFGLLAVLAAVLAPVTDDLITRWFQHDVEMRSRLIFSSVDDSLVRLMHDSSRQKIRALFDHIAEDERVLAVGLCSPDGQLQDAGKAWPKNVNCPDDSLPDAPVFHPIRLRHGTLLSASFPFSASDNVHGHLVILNDMSFATNRSFSARLYMMGFIVLLGIAGAGITVLMAQLTLKGWVRSLRHSLLGTASAGTDPQADPHIAPVIAEIRQLLRDLDISQRTSDGIRIDWSPVTLRLVLTNELPGAEVLVVSNREPYIHNSKPDGTIATQRPASGLVTALEPIIQACGGTWIAHGSGTADRDVVDKNDHIAVPPENPAYTLRRIWLSDEEQEGYYYGLANEGLWPLCHITFVRPTFRDADWQQYVAVNRKFADAIVKEAKTDEPIVLVQDYHFALLPRMVRERLPKATVITFWHIPWPNAEVFGICPWREQILDGLLGSSVIGFHTQLHCNNFIESADRFMECHIDREQSTVSIGGHSAVVRPYPISIAWPPAPLESQAPVSECRAAVFARYNLPADTKLGVGVERFDFTKGIPDRFRAVEIFLEKHPEWVGRFVFLQVAAPTRDKLPAYRNIRKETEDAAARINARFGNENYRPIILEIRHHEPDQVYELFRAADLCIVSSLHDGMNLVAKEFVASRDDEKGVLILSTFAGASRELMEALIVNPFDARSTANAIAIAIGMTPDQQADRMRVMRDVVSENNIYYWAGRMLLDASRLRKRERIESSLAEVISRV
jgi:trehalose 6-phosphate synthase/phosphatase